MIRTLAAAFVVASVLFLAGCGGDGGDSKTGGLFILANFQLVGTQGVANCAIQNNGKDVDDATVTIGAESIPYSGTGGVYQKLALSGVFATGDTVSLTIESPAGNATASGTIPASGASANSVAITGAASGSTFNISH